MAVDYVVPDDVTFCSLIRGFGCLEKADWENIQRIFTRMEKEFGIEPTLSPFHSKAPSP